jgi:tetratricopeptide (TPR) repeat protein
MRSFSLVACLALIAALPWGARAQSAETSDYDAFVREAVAEYNAGSWGEARLLFGKAHELDPNARTWRGMGLSDYESKRYVEAIDELQAALESSIKRLTEAQRAEVERVLERSRRFVAIYTLRMPSDATELRLDGVAIMPTSDGTLRLNPGAHALSVRRASGERIERAFHAEVGGRGTLELESEQPVIRDSRASEAPARADEGGRVWTWIAAGATVALGGATLAMGLLAVDANDTFKARARAGEPTRGAKDDGQRYQLLTNIGLGVTAAAAITTAVLFVVEGASDDAAPMQARGLQLQVGLGAIAVRGTL